MATPVDVDAAQSALITANHSQMEWNTILISVGMICLTAIIGFLIQQYWASKAKATSIKDKRDAEAELSKKEIGDLKVQLATLNASMVPVSAAFMELLKHGLTHLTDKVTDDLLKKIGPPYLLTIAEEQELLSRLEARVRDAGPLVPEIEKDNVIMLAPMIRRLKSEFLLGGLSHTANLIVPSNLISISNVGSEPSVLPMPSETNDSQPK